MTDENQNQGGSDQKGDGENVATAEQNAALEHSDEQAPETTRADALDAGVPMEAGDPSEPVGPEDALGVGSKRGHYADRIEGVGTEHFESVPVQGGGGPVTKTVHRETGKELDADSRSKDAVDVQVDNAPASELVAQNPRAADTGDVKGKKGGVETA